MATTGAILAVILVGIVAVIGGILVLRLHAFVALVLGAILVGLLTPGSSVEKWSLDKVAVPFQLTSPELAPADPDHQGPVPGRPQRAFFASNVSTNAPLDVVRFSEATGEFERGGSLEIESPGTQALWQPSRAGNQLLHTDLVVPLTALDSAQKLKRQTVGERVATGFGSTCTKIGILIALASVVGKCLLDSGAADRIVRSALSLLGQRGAGGAFLGSGFLLGIPVFFDTVFYLMIPLGKAMRMRTGGNYLLYVLCIVAGASMAHSLVPPTPGPLFVAGELGVDIGAMILAGSIVGIFTAGCGYLYATILNRHRELPLRETAELSLKELEALSQKDESELPGLLVSLLPILLPVVLISGVTVVDTFEVAMPSTAKHVLKTLGNKNIALLISAAIALATVAYQKRSRLGDLAQSIEQSLASGGVIILITAGGGAFGQVLQQTGVAGLIRDLPEASPALIVTLAFLITAAVRTAQGSGTVAMITAVGILSGLATSGQLPFHPVYLALAIGCGSKPIAWMNDSGFWVIAKMSGMTESEALKYVTPMSCMMGLVGLLVVVIGVSLFPMA